MQVLTYIFWNFSLSRIGWIVLKALEKSKEHNHHSAASFLQVKVGLLSPKCWHLQFQHLDNRQTEVCEVCDLKTPLQSLICIL